MSANQSASQSADDSITQAATIASRELFNADPKVSREYGKASPRDADDSSVNVGRIERDVSLAVGATLAVLALTKPISLRGLLLGGASAAMIYRGLKGNCALYKSLGINTAKSSEGGGSPTKASDYSKHGIHVEETIMVNKPASELFAFWRSFENLPQVMRHLKEVRVIDDKRSHWVAKAPLGFSVEWDAEIINEIDGKLIAWRSTADATVSSTGSVRFVEHENNRGTEVRVTLEYIPPGGKIGSVVAKLFGEEPATQIRDDLRRFKQQMETGETTSNGHAKPRV